MEISDDDSVNGEHHLETIDPQPQASDDDSVNEERHFETVDSQPQASDDDSTDEEHHFETVDQQPEASAFSSKVERLAQKAMSSFAPSPPAPAKSKPPVASSVPVRIPSPKLNIKVQSAKKTSVGAGTNSAQSSSDALPKISSFDRFNPAKNQAFASFPATETKKRTFDAMAVPVASSSLPGSAQRVSASSSSLPGSTQRVSGASISLPGSAKRSVSDISSSAPNNFSRPVQKNGNNDWIVAQMDKIRELALEVSNMAPDMTGNSFTGLLCLCLILIYRRNSCPSCGSQLCTFLR
jgi:hypothetical protein